MAQKPEFLTNYELKVFELINKGKSPEEIATEINNNPELNKKKNGQFIERTPENIRKTRVVVRNKVEKELQRTANSLRLDDLRETVKDAGLLISFDWVNDTKVYLVLTVTRGILAWWEHTCSEKCLPICQETLDIIQKERDIQLLPEHHKIPLLNQFQEIIAQIKQRGTVKYSRKRKTA